MFDPWVRKNPWRRKWQCTLVFLPGKSHGQSLAHYSPWGHKGLNTHTITLFLFTFSNYSWCLNIFINIDELFLKHGLVIFSAEDIFNSVQCLFTLITMFSLSWIEVFPCTCTEVYNLFLQFLYDF